MVTGKLGAAQLGGAFGRRCVGPASTRGRLDGMAAEDVDVICATLERGIEIHG